MRIMDRKDLALQTLYDSYLHIITFCKPQELLDLASVVKRECEPDWAPFIEMLEKTADCIQRETDRLNALRLSIWDAQDKGDKQ